MRIEGQHRRRPALRDRRLYDGLQQSLMSTMKTIEVADRENGIARWLMRRETSADLHATLTIAESTLVPHLSQNT